MIIAINKNKKDKVARAVLSRMMFRVERDVFVWHDSNLYDDIHRYLDRNSFENRSILFILPSEHPNILPTIIPMGLDQNRGLQNQIGLKYPKIVRR